MKIIFLITSIILITIFSPCSKAQPAPTTKEKLVGSWCIDSVRSVEVINDIPNSMPAEIGQTGDYIEFKADGACHFSFGGDIEDGNYILLDNSTIQIKENRVLQIKELSTKKFYLYGKRQLSATGYLEEKYFFHKVN